MSLEGKSLDVINADLDNVTITDRGTLLIKETPIWLVEVCPMLVNDRLVLTPKSNVQIWDYGWCYDQAPTALIAVLAAIAFDPVTELEPVGFKKRTGLIFRSWCEVQECALPATCETYCEAHRKTHVHRND